MKAEILAVGEELLAPGQIEGDSLYLTEQLAALGIPVVFRGIVGDEERLLERAIRQALDRADLVFVTGGLGPTADDRTRDAAAGAVGRGMRLDPTILAELERRFEKRGIAMPDVNRKQAMVIEGAEVLVNRLGTAPGQFLATSGKTLVLLPGPPRELQPMFQESVLPRLKSVEGILFHRTKKIWVAGLPESVVEQKIAPLYRDLENPLTTVLASPGQVEIRLTARAASASECEAMNEQVAARMREVLGRHILSENEESLEEVVGRLLLERGFRLAIAESLTGGLVAHRITQVSGASRYFDMAFVTYSNESKSKLLGVPDELFARVGAVSEEVAVAMAKGARERAGSDVALSTTGIAGPTGGSTEKPVGLVYIGLATPESVRAECFQFPGERSHVKRWTAQTALNLLRLELLKTSDAETRRSGKSSQ